MGIFSSKKQTNKKEAGQQEIKKEIDEKKPLAKEGKSALNKNILLIKQPRITEKSQSLKQFRQYVFDTIKKANKLEIKKAIEQIYNVKVEKIRIINIPSKRRRVELTFGKKSGYKKAIVTLKQNQQIEVIPQK